MNRSLDFQIETVFLTCLPQYTSVASTLVRDVIRNGGDVAQFLPQVVADYLKSLKPKAQLTVIGHPSSTTCSIKKLKNVHLV